MPARLEQPYTAIFRNPQSVHTNDVPPPVDYLGSNCPEYDRYVSALFFAPFSPHPVVLEKVDATLRSFTRKIRPDWTDSEWQASLRLKNSRG